MSRLMPMMSLALAGLWWGCGGATPPPLKRRPDGCESTPPTRGDPGHAVQLYLRVEHGFEPRALCPGDPLSAQQALVLDVEIDRPAYVRLMFVDPAGAAGALQPQGGEGRTRRAEFRVPSGLLTGRAGQAQLLLVVSADPLEEADPAMDALYQVVRETGTWVDQQGRLHPPERQAPTGEALHFDTTPDMHADFDEHRVAMLGLSLSTGR